MKITKRQLRRLVREMYPSEGITPERLEQLTVAHQKLMNEIEVLYAEVGIDSYVVDELRDQFTEALFPLFAASQGEVV